MKQLLSFGAGSLPMCEPTTVVQGLCAFAKTCREVVFLLHVLQYNKFEQKFKQLLQLFFFILSYVCERP